MTAEGCEDDSLGEGRHFLEVEHPGTASSNAERWTFSIRILGIVTLALLGSSRILLRYRCSAAGARKGEATQPLVTKWRVATKQTRVRVRLNPLKTSRTIATLDPGDIVEAYGDGTPRYMFLLEPHRGFALRKGETLGNDFFERVTDGIEASEPVSSSCPLLYDGWWPENKRPSGYLYAPGTMVVAQQLWNAMQVFEMLLLVSLAYADATDFLKFAALCVASLVVTCLLPFSHYVTSPSGHVFAWVTLLTCLWAIRSNAKLALCVGDKRTATGQHSVVREETIAFLCNLCCSLYNHHANRHTWPNWNRHFHKIDKLFGWVGGTPGTQSDCYNGVFYTMGMSSVRAPLYVARNNTGTTTGANVFVVIWSFLPFLYVCYFGCLYLLSSLSPYKNVQRGLCLFGAFHFLFLTDAVAYAYGRGFYTPHAEFFHWSERWAWRIAILLPVYQNCTNGHWMKGHSIPGVGKVVHYFMGVWSICFFLIQVLSSDVFRFVRFLNGWEERSLLKMLGLPFPQLFSYHSGLVVMFIVYGLTLVGGFSNYRVFVSRPRTRSSYLVY